MSEPPRVQLPAAAVAGLSACWALSPTAPCSDASGTRVSVLLSITLALLSSRGEDRPCGTGSGPGEGECPISPASALDRRRQGEEFPFCSLSISSARTPSPLSLPS